MRVQRVGGALLETLRRRLGGITQRAAPAPQPGERPRRGLARMIYGATLKPILWPDATFPWIVPALARSRSLVRAHRPDALITVSHPFSSHLVGLALKRAFPALRWIVDVGDPFALLRETPLNNPRLYGGLNRRAEHHVLQQADAVAVTVESARAAYRDAFPDVAGKIIVAAPPLAARCAAGRRPR